MNPQASSLHRFAASGRGLVQLPDKIAAARDRSFYVIWQSSLHHSGFYSFEVLPASSMASYTPTGVVLNTCDES